MGQSSSSYKASEDPCNPSLQAYLKCVEAHKDGLTEGDDCSDEGSVYKACRKEYMEQRKKTKSDENKECNCKEDSKQRK